jgi:hypothetical protein
VARLVLVLALLAFCPGCDRAAPGPAPVSWRFADGRDCAAAGVATVRLQVMGNDKGSFACPQGAAPASVTVDALTVLLDVEAVALSPQQGELYRGSALVLGSEPTVVVLYADQRR